MEFSNYTPFPADAWETVNSRNKWNATCLVRAKFRLEASPDKTRRRARHKIGLPYWQLRLHPEQGELFAEDQFYSDEYESSVRYESDYINFKPHTDIVVNAKAFRPFNVDGDRWSCAVKVYSDNAEKPINMLSLSVEEDDGAPLPIRYENAKGGVLKIKHHGKDDEERSLDLHNPVGCGKYPHAHEACKRHSQIEYDGEGYKKIPPGFGFIHRSWKSRLDYAGTYDDAWLENQHPLPPHDFNHFHNQAAHPALITQEYLKAGSKIVLSNVIDGHAQIYFDIPEYRFMSRVFTESQVQHQIMHLDTLIIDLANDDNEPQVYGSWRSYTPLIDDAMKAEVMLVPSVTQTSASRTMETMVRT